MTSSGGKNISEGCGVFYGDIVRTYELMNEQAAMGGLAVVHHTSSQTLLQPAIK